MKIKSKEKGYVGIAIIVFILAVAVVSNMLASTYSTMISLYFTDTESNSSEVSTEEALAAANEITQTLEEEGAVLLKNSGETDSGVLPIAEGTKINLFGNCSYQTLYQGSGSASSWFKQELNVTMKEGLENAGFEVNSGLWQFYEDNYQERSDQEGGVTDMSGADHSILEETMEQYESYSYEGENILDYSESYSDVAVVVFGRAGGEGSDAIMDMADCVGGDAGKHYLELQSVELELLDYVEQNYDTVIVILNTSTSMELGFLEDDAIDAALWVGMPGSTGCNAIGEILSGAVNPSGHLSDTYAYEVESAPSYYNFGDYTYANYDGTCNKYVHYQEGIYVGYRYYETAAADGYIDFDDTVQYAFGYGLSYTSFDWEVTDVELGDIGGEITVSVEVTNVGDVAGKDVVQLYYSPPYYEEENIEKSSIVLSAFEKTSLLDPGASETLTLTMNVDDMSSYDYTNSECYVLSQGTYYLQLQTDSHTIKVNSDGTEVAPIEYTVNEKVIYNDENDGARSTDVVAATNLFDDITAGDGEFGEEGTVTSYVSRSDWAGTMPTSREDAEDMNASDEVISLMSNGLSGSSIDIDSLPDAEAITTDADNGLEISDMVGLDYDDPLWDDLLDQLSTDELVRLYGTCGWSNPAILSIQKAAAIDMDGAEGLHNLTTDKTSNQYCNSTVRACTWNKELAYEMGSVFGDEAVANGISSIYGMTVNIHRSPFGGRNFESYSEDSLLTGEIAAQEVAGLQDKGVSVFLKHFVLNDQEANRSGVHTWANEQAIREIYTKSFEIVTKETNCTGYMTSYNYIGAGWTGANYNLLMGLARGEWGFSGRIITDACMNFEVYSPDAGLLAGTDMWLAPMTATVSETITGTNYGMQRLREAAHRQLYIFANSSAIELGTEVNTSWVWIIIGIDVVALAAILLVIFKMVIPGFKRKEEEHEKVS